jgi:hypothetical protein
MSDRVERQTSDPAWHGWKTASSLRRRRLDAVWPEGLHARLSPTLRILDVSGKVVLLECWLVAGARGVREGGRVYLTPPFD